MRSVGAGWMLVISGLALGCAATAVGADGGPTRLEEGVLSFDDTYDGHSWVWNNCSRALGISGAEPAQAGRYPVAIFLVGTNGKHDYPGILDNVLPMLASHGFVAASLEYENGTAFGAAQNCNLYRDNASCIVRNDADYVDGAAHSAVARLCSRPKADCGQGVVFLGHSQGGLTAMQAFTQAPREPPLGAATPRLVAAAPMGVGNLGYAAGVAVVDLAACMNAGNLALDSSRLLVIDGENDGFFGGPHGEQAGVQSELEAITSQSCPTPSWDCRRANGSGFLIVRGDQVSSGHAGHEYMSTATISFGEPNWVSRTRAEPWTLDQVAGWLRAQTSP